MASAPGRLDNDVKIPVQVRMFPEEIATVDAFAAELSQQSYGAAFSRAEALRIAAMEWLKARQARRASVTPRHHSASRKQRQKQSQSQRVLSQKMWRLSPRRRLLSSHRVARRRS